MNKENNYLKIPNHYVKDNYLQSMLGYKDYLILYGNEKIMYYNNFNIRTDRDKYNTYLDDERRHEFPYSQIPEHIEKRFLVKCTYVNQIFNFDRPYISIHDGLITKLTFYKDGNQAICNSKLLNGSLVSPKSKIISRDELENYLKTGFIEQLTTDKYNSIYMFDINGNLYSFILKKEQDWINQEKERLIDIVNNRIGQYDKSALNEIKKSIQLLNTIEPFYPINGRLMIKFKSTTEIKMEAFSVKYLGPDLYEITIADIPITIDSLPTLNLRQINFAKEPKIKLSLNPNILQEVVEQEKAKVLTRNNN